MAKDSSNSAPEADEEDAPPNERIMFPVVAIGASAGGLGACSKLLDSLPKPSGIAFILVQHLDPTHESMMVELLASHTSMVVRQVVDGMRIEVETLYVIPPGAYLSVSGDTLHLSRPEAPHGARLPVDFLLRSLADSAGEHAACVILSGTGADGSLGLMAIKEQGGFIVAQDPDEAEFDGMPRNAIATGSVDVVLPVAKIQKALVDHYKTPRLPSATVSSKAEVAPAPNKNLADIIALLRQNTDHDFSLYKPGTLQRRIERRMTMTAIENGNMEAYLDKLRNDEDEIDLLAKDLLIHVTSFFRDQEVFEYLAENTIPEMIRAHTLGQPLRIWIAGCSTGEEAYSLAILFHEQIDAMNTKIRLQVFASDVDPEAVAKAREGLYPKTIESAVSPERLSRFFTLEDAGYRVANDLRSSIIFAVQDVLADPPFSRLDMISCRNLLIYLQTKAQERLIALFHFALSDGGILVLGNAENIGNGGNGFSAISKAQRIYRHVSRSTPADLRFTSATQGGVRVPVRDGSASPASRQATLAERCRRMILETYSPAAVLINEEHHCLFSVGPVDQYLRVASGPPTADLFAMLRDGIGPKFRSVIRQARQENRRIESAGGQITKDGKAVSFKISAQPMPGEDEGLLLLCFIDEPEQNVPATLRSSSPGVPRVEELEDELEATKHELESAVRHLEISNEEQRVINEEALSVNEEYQSTNEELLTSKEELQSLNEELTALNSQLQETLERQRTTSNDLQNVLYSTDVATLFLDTDLNIRFFTPATRTLFNIIQGDIGRPLADLSWLSKDSNLEKDARTVLRSLETIEQEIETPSDQWYLRRISPYRTQDNQIEGVVITFTDVTERHRAAKALEMARQDAEHANIGKSRFLAAASHDLRQPLQTLSLLQGLLANAVHGEAGRELLTVLEQTVGAMSGMLNTLLDINQIDAGIIRPNMVDFPVGDVLGAVLEEFRYHANAKELNLRAVPCSLTIRSDPHLLEQMIRNLVSNALKYTLQGKILLGCRRHGNMLSVEVWDTGIGIPDHELQAIFEEYHQVDNAGRDRSRGLGLGLSIVYRLSKLLNHPVHVRSCIGKGSAFSIKIPLPQGESMAQAAEDRADARMRHRSRDHRKGSILVVEDDPEVRRLLELFLKDEGHHTIIAVDGIDAVKLVNTAAFRPNLIIADFNLPNGMTGLETATAVRAAQGWHIPVIVMTGDISTATMRKIGAGDCMALNKPVNTKKLSQVIQSLLPPPPSSKQTETGVDAGLPAPTIFLIDDDKHIRVGIRHLLSAEGMDVEDYESCEAFLESYKPRHNACLLVDAKLTGMGGLQLLQQLKTEADPMPAIMITGHHDVPMAVDAMRAGASDFIIKPIDNIHLLESIRRSLELSQDARSLEAWREDATKAIGNLTRRQRQIMDLIIAGAPNKNIAADLGISQRTVENHRAKIMKATGSRNLPELVRTAFAASDDTSL